MNHDIKPSGITKYAKSQLEFEQLAREEQRELIEKSDRAQADKNYSTNTALGREIMKRRYIDLETGDEIDIVQATVQAIRDTIDQRSKQKGRKHDGLKLILEKLPILEYVDERKDPWEVLAGLTIKAVIDAYNINDAEENPLPVAAAVFAQVGDVIDIQLIDALCRALADEKVYRDQAGRWQRQHQGVGNKRTNIALGQKQMLRDVDFELMEFKWTRDQKYSVGCFMIDCFMIATGLLEKDWNPSKVKGVSGLTALRYSSELIDMFPKAVDRIASGKLRGYPMIEAPKEWKPLLGPDGQQLVGVDNHSGGYHNPANRVARGMVRTRWGTNQTQISQLGIDFLNRLGQVAYRPDIDSCESFEWAVMNDDQKVDGVHPMPTETSAKLKAERDAYMAIIKKDGSHPDIPAQGSEEHRIWRSTQKERFTNAVKAEQKYIRTRNTLDAVRAMQEQPKVFFSWSNDYRGRTYPQQMLLTPQGSHAERSLLRFAQGEAIDGNNTRQLDNIHEAIGSAFLGTRTSYTERREWSERNIKDVCQSLDGDAGDINTIGKRWKADEPWDALQLARCFKEAIIDGGGYWDVPLGTDASQSGTQILGGLLRDEATLIATNVFIDPAKFGQLDPGPADGYQKVNAKARWMFDTLIGGDPNELITPLTTLDWAEKRYMAAQKDHAVRYWVGELLTQDGWRKAAKITSMPMVYGSTFLSNFSGLVDHVRDGMGVDLMAELGGKSDPAMAFKRKNMLVSELTQYLRTAVYLTFPHAMRGLDWLKALASQRLSQSDSLSWTLHDGTVIEYFEPTLATKDYSNLMCGRVRTGVEPEGTNDNDTIKAFAPGFVHSLDGLLLRVALKDWDGPMTTIHDSIRVLPSQMDGLKDRLKDAYIEVCEKNPLSGLAEQMDVELSELPELTYGQAELKNARKSKYMFH